MEIRVADAWSDVQPEAPFDAIHVGAAAASIPPVLLDQLRVCCAFHPFLPLVIPREDESCWDHPLTRRCAQPGGRLIIPVGQEDQELLQVDKLADGSTTTQPLLAVRYVPLVPGLASQ